MAGMKRFIIDGDGSWGGGEEGAEEGTGERDIVSPRFSTMLDQWIMRIRYRQRKLIFMRQVQIIDAENQRF